MADKALHVLRFQQNDLVAVRKAVDELEALGYHLLGDPLRCCIYMHRALLLDPLHRETLQLFQSVSGQYPKIVEEEFSKPEATDLQKIKLKINRNGTNSKSKNSSSKNTNNDIPIGIPSGDQDFFFRGIPLIQSDDLLYRIRPTERDQILRSFRLISMNLKKRKQEKMYFLEQDFYRSNPHMKYFQRFKSFKNLLTRIFNIYFSTTLVSDISKKSSCVVGVGSSARIVLEDGNKKRRFEHDTYQPTIWIDQFFIASVIQTIGNLFDCNNLLFESIVLYRERTINEKSFKDFIMSHFKKLQKMKIKEHNQNKKNNNNNNNNKAKGKIEEVEEEYESLEESIEFSDFDHFLLPVYQLLREMKLLNMVPGEDEKSFHKFVTEKSKSFFNKLLESAASMQKDKKKKKRLTKLEFMTAMNQHHHRLIHFNLLDEKDYFLRKGKSVNDSESEVPYFFQDSSSFKKFGRTLYFGTKEWNFGFFIMYGMSLIYEHYLHIPEKKTVTPEDFLSSYQVTLPKIDFDVSDQSNLESLGNQTPTAKLLKVFPIESGNDPIGGKFKTYENCIIQMKAYAFGVFRKLRKIFEIEERSFFEDTFSVIKFLGNWLLLNRNKNLVFQSSMGKSGTFFFYSNDGRYLVKKLTKNEFKIFLNTLPHYYGHQSRVTRKKFFSCLSQYVFCFSLHVKEKADDGIEFVEDIFFGDEGENYYFVVMKNVFSTNNEINEIYDLKGSKLSRTNIKGPVMKDNDLKRKLFIGKESKDELFRILNRDVDMLNYLELTDYSLLLGIHYKRGRRATILPHQYFPKGVNERINLSKLAKETEKQRKKKNRKHSDITSIKSMFQGLENSLPNENYLTSDNIKNMNNNIGFKEENLLSPQQIRELYQDDDFDLATPAEEEEEEEETEEESAGESYRYFTKEKGIISSNRKEIYYFGIIDLLTKFTLVKAAERTAKTIRNLGNKAEISSAPHEYYSKRFLYFLDNVFQ